MKTLLFICSVSFAHGLSVSHIDLLRAHTAKPGASSALRADSHDGVFRAINEYMVSGGWRAKACEEFSLRELEAVSTEVTKHAADELNALYSAKKDRRTLLAPTPLPLTAPHHSIAHNTTRDGHCAYILMQWAHHIPTEARHLLQKANVVLPLMPSAPTVTEDKTYNAKVSCTSCHYYSNKEEEVEAADPNTPRWGGNSTLMRFEVNVNMTDISDSPDHPKWRFNYFYDANQGAAVYHHLEGQDDEVCRSGKITQGTPCAVIFANNGRAYLNSTEKCCKLGGILEHYGAVRSTWLYTESKYIGNTTVNGVVVDEWFKQGSSDNHYYVTPDQYQRPVRYMEHKNNILKQWDFNLETYKTENLVDASFFDPPTGAGCDTLC